MRNKLVVSVLILMAGIMTGQIYLHVFVEHLGLWAVLNRMAITSGITLILYVAWADERKRERQKKLNELTNWNPLA